MEEEKQMQSIQAQPTQQPVISVRKKFQIDIWPHHPEEKTTHICIHKDCLDNLIPICNICLDRNHSANNIKSLRKFCENLEKIVQNSAEHQENIGRAYEAKIQNFITKIEKSRYFNAQDLAFLQNKLFQYQDFSINNQIKRLLSKLAQAKTENRPESSLSLHKDLKQEIMIENNNQIIFIEISRVNGMKNFEQELDKEMEEIDQQHS